MTLKADWRTAIGALILTLVSACAGSDGPASAVEPVPAPATPSPTASEPTLGFAPDLEPTAAPETIRIDAQDLIGRLASDDLNGRDNGSVGSARAQEIIIDVLDDLAEPPPGAIDGYRQRFAEGVNVVGIQRGTGDLADEYVLLGAHYDHLAPGDCAQRDQPDDLVCNGAADNASGVAAVLMIAEELALQQAVDNDLPDRRSLIIALWDAEEDGLVGATHYATDAVVPLAQTVAYVNFDIQGASLLPSVANATILVGAETGGQPLIDIATEATNESSLDYILLSLLFGQGRGDYAVFAAHAVPIVSFTDAGNGCYHTVSDDIEHLDFDKLARQIPVGVALTRGLLTTANPPVFDHGAPISVFGDAEQLLALLTPGQDLGLPNPDFAERTASYIADLEAIVAAGPATYDTSLGQLLSGTETLINDLAGTGCLRP